MKIERIGDCTLYLADCMDVLPTLDGVDAVVTDPPYEAIMHKAKASAARRIRTDGGPDLSVLDFDCIDGIRDEVANLVASVCGGWSLIFCAPEGVGRWADAINETTAKYKRACIWVKPDSTPQLNGQGPAMGYENVIASWCGSGKSRWNAGGKRGVYTHLTNSKRRHGLHPTEKPIRLMKELLADFTNSGDLICDPFMGSGTTGVACAEMGRKFIGIEKDARYFDIACERISDAYKQPDLFVPQPVAI